MDFKKIFFLFFVVSISYSNEINTTVIGDSISVMCLDDSKYIVDGKVGRKFSEVYEVVRRLDKENKLKENVVIELGTNGGFNYNIAIKTINYLKSKNKKIYFVNVKVPRKWEQEVNNSLFNIEKKYPYVKVIDQYSVSKKSNYLFYSDNYHLNKIGCKLYKDLIQKSIEIKNRGEK